MVLFQQPKIDFKKEDKVEYFRQFGFSTQLVNCLIRSRYDHKNFMNLLYADNFKDTVKRIPNLGKKLYIEMVYKSSIILYYYKNKLSKLSTAKIVFDAGKIFVTTNNIDTKTSNRVDLEYRDFDEDKNNIMENFSQTGSYYNINGKYTWSQGIYNIINRPKEESDDFYNIVFDLVIPDDQHIVDEIFETTNKETAQCNEIIRIMTRDEVIKIIEVSIYSYFDESGIIIRQGLINDITQHYHYEASKPVDFLLDGFKNSKKLALLIEPLNKKQYKFSKGFYYLIEKDYEEYNRLSLSYALPPHTSIEGVVDVECQHFG